MSYPTALDTTGTLPNPTGTSTLASPDHGALHTLENVAIIGVETKIGTGASTPTNNTFLIGNGTGTSVWGKVVPAGAIVGTTDSQTLTNKTLTSPTINTAVISNPTLTVDTVAGYTVSNTGTIYGISVTTGAISSALSLGSTLSVTGAVTLSSTASIGGQLSTQTGTAPPAAGASTAGIKMSSTANLGLFFGDGAPTFSAAKGSIYINTTATTTTTRLYINSNATTGWSSFTVSA